ncbi:MAG: hypothetical protein WAT29_02990 [Thiolinea sp.]
MQNDQNLGSFKLQTKEVARLLGVKARVVYGLPLPYQQLQPNGKRLYRQTDVERLQAQSIHQPVITV